jgi:glycosyltransferase involved in cell wall biosynthesis
MRIAVVTTSYPTYDGDPSGHFVQAEVAELERLGHQVEVIRPAPGGAFGWPGAPSRIRERPLRAVEAAAWMARASAGLRMSPDGAASSLTQRLQRLGAFGPRGFVPERVIAHWCVPCAFPIALSARSAELDVVSHGGDVRLLCQLPPSARGAIARAVLRRATRWRFVSEELLVGLASVISQDDARALQSIAEIVPGTLDVPDVREDAAAKRSAVAGRRLYVCAGRLVASKRVDTVIDYVAAEKGRGERVLVVLGDGPDRARLERVARAWQIDVRFLGKTTRREALGWIGAADELVHASRAEGLSTVVREASLLGVPVTILS